MPTDPIEHPLLAGIVHRPTPELRVLLALLDEIRGLRADLAAAVVLPGAAAPVAEVAPAAPVAPVAVPVTPEAQPRRSRRRVEN